ncbi:MAG: YhbY family RNA-binding protein [Syntrophales bacterium]|nr:YhbY family RNA-binding protein [Syntrophales bacterium]
MTTLKGFQKKHLKGLAHSLKPMVQIGKEGVTEGVIRAVGEGLLRHELIKIKFVDFKDKEQKAELSREIEVKTESDRIGMVGHTVIFYKQQVDPLKRKIVLPQRKLLKFSP